MRMTAFKLSALSEQAFARPPQSSSADHSLFAENDASFPTDRAFSLGDFASFSKKDASSAKKDASFSKKDVSFTKKEGSFSKKEASFATSAASYFQYKHHKHTIRWAILTVITLQQKATKSNG